MSDSLRRSFRDTPARFEAGAAERTAKRGVLGAIGGLVLGSVVVLSGIATGGALPIAGAIIGGLAGAVWGFNSSDPQKIQNRGILIKDPLFEETRKVYISAEQWRDIKNKLTLGVEYDEFPPELAKQFVAASEPPPAAN
ncbi:MAG: hypothetical protein HY692_07705 [Cyanobacteria bacterium NC_groundwater_1444_Ag_S-0.65um_54_12]|nr:hypothetical protein [Cyanobacteria bacterium NC_groundwater_1444_Ag_S-0.65um_54_12]